LKSNVNLRPITSLWTSKNEALAYVKLPATLVSEENSYQMHPVLLESCLQVAWAALDTSTRDIFIPTNIALYEFFGSANEVWTHVRLLPSQADNITAEIVIADAHGNVLARIEGLNARRSTPASMPPDSQIVAELLHAPIAERRKMLAQHIEKFVRSVMGLDETYSIDENQVLQDLGLDSLMAVELRNLLQRSLGRDLRPTIVFDYPSIATMAEYLDTLLWAADELPANSSASQRDEIRI
jgi:acyl carrier protein